MNLFLLSLLLAFFSLSAPISGDEAIRQIEAEESIFDLLEQSLRVFIVARVSEAGDEAIWNVESSETTLPGRGVEVRLVGSNVIVVAQFTPYLQEEGSLILVAQGQVWVSSSPLEEVKYLATLKNIPIRLGEKVFFFPLGVRSLEKEAENMYDIELEITILPSGASAQNPLP